MTIPRITFLSVLLAACAGGPPPQSSQVYYDVPGEPAALPAPLRSLDVIPVSWLAGNSMYYRLAYADGGRREHYADTRWTAQPSELLAVRLQRSLMGSTESDVVASNNVTLCRLRLDIDDFVQVFDTQSSSRLVFEGRASLYGAQQVVLKRRLVNLSQPAGADARSGAAASGPLADALSRELQAWIKQECKKTS
jgi:cholesterol transport system auxiliary component